MKKIFLVMIGSLLFVSATYAQQQLFKLNDNNECEISGTIEVSSSKTMPYMVFKDWLYKISTGLAPIFVKDVRDQLIKANIIVNTRRVNNPISGIFVENLSFKCEATFSDKTVTYRLYGFEIKQMYAGWGAKNTTEGLDYQMSRYEKAKADLAEAKDPNSTMSRSERSRTIRESKETIEEVEKKLKSSTKVMERNIEKLNKMLK
ncbi:MAG: hypothetical protein ACFN40_07480 [Bacteroidota bacterium]